MKAKKYSPIAALLCCIMLLPVLLTGCGSSLEGTWVCAKAKSGYPDIMIVEHDGKGSIEGVDMNWYTKNDRLYINAVRGVSYSFDYEYKFDSGFLLLDERVYIRQGSKNEDVYAYAERLYKNGNYEAAQLVFVFLDDFKDSEQRIEDCKEAQMGVEYDKAAALYDSGEYEEARKAFASVIDYKDSRDRISQCNEALNSIEYKKAVELYNSENYEEAQEIFTSLGDYNDSRDFVSLCVDALRNKQYEEAKSLMEEGNYSDASDIFSSLKDYKDSKTLQKECQEGIKESNYNYAKELLAAGYYKDAKDILDELNWYEYKDSYELRIEYCTLVKKALCNTWKCAMQVGDYPDTLTFGTPDSDYTSGTGTMDGTEIDWYASYSSFDKDIGYLSWNDSDKKYYSCQNPEVNKNSLILTDCVYFTEDATDAYKYDIAEKLYNSHNYKNASIVYTALGSYKDCEKKAALCRGKS